MKEKQILPLFWHLAWSSDGLYGTWNQGASSCTCRRVQNGAKPLSRSGKNVRQAIREKIFNTKAQKSRAASFHERICRPFLSCTRGLFTTTAHTTRLFLRPCDQATRHALLPSSETCTLHGSAKQSMASVLLSTRANLPQHEYENRAAFFMRRRKANCKALFLQAISSLRSLPHASLTPHSCVPPDLSRCHTEQPSHLRGVACSHQTKEGGVSLCSACLALFLLLWLL